MILNNMKKLTNKDLVQLYYEELWNKGRKEYIDILFTEDISFYGSLGISSNGKSEFLEYMNMIHSAIPNLFHSVIEMVCENDSIAVRALYNGRHTGQLFEYKGTNNKIVYNGASFFKFKDGKISYVWVLGDLNSLTKQLS